MKLYNSLSRQVENFKPLGDEVRIYSCGPTVYDHAHIGNLAAYIFADSLRRALTTSGQKVKHVMNYTDVDDKTIARSASRYPHLDPKEALVKLTDHYIELFNQDMAAIGNQLEALTFVRATNTIEEMKQLIINLHKGGFAYLADDGVYFSIDSYRRSGKTYGQLSDITASSTSEARIQNDEYDKASVHDFALWKKQKEGEPAWPLSIDGQKLDGRPGWHIECSAMSQQQLGLPFDIHTGGIDLIFPHHENEIAQSTALGQNTVMAQIFAHNNHVLVDGKKMSKSANNFYTLQDITKRSFDPLSFRLMILQTHYRKEAHFSWQNLEAAQNRLNNWRAAADLVWQSSTGADDIASSLWKEAHLAAAMNNDLDTPQAVFLVDKLLSSWSEGISTGDAERLEAYLQTLDDYLGLGLADGQDISAPQKELLAQRQAARNAKDWDKADQLRTELKTAGLAVRDTASGQIWSRLR
jgi:cysteinyl-tRNA synthetase